MFLIDKSRMPVSHPSLRLGFSFEHLYVREGLVRIDAAFIGFLREIDGALTDRLIAAREAPSHLAAKAE